MKASKDILRYTAKYDKRKTSKYKEICTISFVSLLPNLIS